MKRLLLILAISLIGCSKEEPVKTCNCGIVVQDGIADIGICFWLKVKNHCSGNTKMFCIEEDKWMNYHKGMEFCMPDSVEW